MSIDPHAMRNRNSEESLKNWVDKALAGSTTLTLGEASRLKDIANAAITKGSLRGDISDDWRMAMPGLTTADIPELYV